MNVTNLIPFVVGGSKEELDPLDLGSNPSQKEKGDDLCATRIPTKGPITRCMVRKIQEGWEDIEANKPNGPCNE